VIQVVEGIGIGLTGTVVVFLMTVGAMTVWREREDFLFTLRHARPWHRCGGRRVTLTHYGTDFRAGGATTALVEWCECHRSRFTPVDTETGELLGDPGGWRWRVDEDGED